ncbi:MAG: penicillin-binding protein 1C [Planctomycetes bacterium]|nr:penicillin-binding protein 1C [Planctomycetota bacterium]
MARKWRKRLFRWGKRGLVLTGAFCILFLAYVYAVPFPKELLSRKFVKSIEIVDREGRPLREVLSADSGRLRWKALAEISPLVAGATIAAEDARFRYHPGVDPFSILRAVWQNVAHGRRVSGASTITMQVVRLVRPRRRTLRAKLSEAVLALRLERVLTKDHILEEYLNRAPYGNQLFGIEAAAQMYFDKPARDLSLSEAAFLAGLPQGPTRLNPYRNLDGAMKRRNWILGRMYDCNFIDEMGRDRARRQPITLHPRRWRFRAPHFVDYVLACRDPGDGDGPTRIETTLDLRLQEKVQGIVREHLKGMKDRNVRNAAVVVIHNATGQIRSMVGSADFFDGRELGQNNGAVAPRPPGSTVKAFTYTLAFEQGMTPADIVADLPAHFETPEGDYCPENYDGQTYGPTRLRAALANSLNISAVKVLSRVGVDALFLRMREMDFTHLTKPAQHYGLGLTLGSGEVTLLELCNGFATIARLGEWIPAVTLTAQNPQRPRRVFDPIACYQTIDILSDPLARIPAFGGSTPLNLPFRAAVKTGTSPNYRDNWTVGFTPEYTVGVWVGDFRNNPMQNVSGITGAGPIFRAVMMAIYENRQPTWYDAPPGVERCDVCSLSGMRPGPWCPSTVNEVFRAGTAPRHECTYHRRIRIDRTTGLRATAKCPVDDVIEKTIVCLPPEYDAWARAGGVRTRLPEPCQHGATEMASAPAQVRIVYPNPWDVFVIDPNIPPEYQTISLRAVTPQNAESLQWFVDGAPVVSPSDTLARWQLRPGEHTILVQDGSGGSCDWVRIRVE